MLSNKFSGVKNYNTPNYNLHKIKVLKKSKSNPTLYLSTMYFATFYHRLPLNLESSSGGSRSLSVLQQGQLSENRSQKIPIIITTNTGNIKVKKLIAVDTKKH